MSQKGTILNERLERLCQQTESVRILTDRTFLHLERVYDCVKNCNIDVSTNY